MLMSISITTILSCRSFLTVTHLAVINLILFKCYVDHRDLHSFPTRRSSDLSAPTRRRRPGCSPVGSPTWRSCRHVDRKSTRLNSSHTVISYAVFCLKKKK